MDRRVDIDRARLTHWARRAALLALPVAFLAVFFVWPVAAIISRGISANGFREVFTDDRLRHVAWFTLWQATVSTLLTLLIALPGAYVLSRYRFAGRSVVRALVTVPFVLPTVVVGAAFTRILPDRFDHTVWAILGPFGLARAGADVGEGGPGFAVVPAARHRRPGWPPCWCRRRCSLRYPGRGCAA